MKNCLYVPITMEALVEGESGPRVADFTASYNNLKYMPIGKYVMNGYFTDKSELPGIHLHWTLPDALLHGEADEKEGLVFPSLPNRWVLQRISTGNNGFNRAAWLIESDSLNNEPKTLMGIYKTTIPYMKMENGVWTGAGEKGEPFAYMGMVNEYGTENKKTAYLNKLDALCAGDPVFTAYYPRCKTVFGFYDNMKTSEPGLYTYILAGYYENLQADPLSQKTADELNWKIVNDGLKASTTLCHSIVMNIEWKGPAAQYKSGAPLGDPRVYMGNTEAEALSRFLKDKMPDTPGLERVFTALQYNALKDLDNTGNPDSLIEFEDLLHERQFTASEDYYAFRLYKTGEEKKLPDDVYKNLNSLNENQRKLEDETSRLLSLKNEIYFAWCKYVTIATSPFMPMAGFTPPETGSATEKEFLDLAEKLIADYKNGHSLTTGLIKKIDDEYKNLNEYLKPFGYYIQKNVAGRSYEAGAPAALICGEGTGRPRKFDIYSGDKLPCRLNTAESFTLSIENNNVTLKPDDILSLCEKTKKSLPDAIEKLTAEGIFMNKKFARQIAVCAYKKISRQYTEDSLKTAIPAIQARQNKPQYFSGTLPCVISAIEWSGQPWSPLLMHWEVSVLPARTNEASDNSFAAFELKGPDYKYNGGNAGKDSISVQGSAIITPHAVTHMYDSINSLIDDYGQEGKHYEALKKAAQIIKDMDALAQRLDGFDEAMIMRDRWPSVPVLGLDNEAILKDMTEIFKGYMPTPKMETALQFMPVRAGFMKLTKLMLIDSFGQTKQVKTSEAAVSEYLHTDKSGWQAMFLPRFNHPCVLRFNWLNHKNENQFATDKETSPVFGYVIPNFLDKNLQIHNADGILLGFVQQGTQGVRWMSAPGSTVTVKDISPEHLQNYVQGILNAPPQTLAEFLHYLDCRLSRSLPAVAEPFMQLCFGNVIALARAKINVTSTGLLPYIQSWETKLETNKYENQNIYIKMGDFRKIHDGFIGFFRENKNKNIYSELHIDPDVTTTASDYLKHTNQLETTLAKEAVNITLMLIPGGKVSLYTGFLPVRAISLDAAFYSKAVAEMEMMFRLSPILAEKEQFEAYLPGGLKDTWSFMFTEKDGRLSTIDQIYPPSALPPCKIPPALEGFMNAKYERRKI